jgi:hypothetical protein
MPEAGRNQTWPPRARPVFAWRGPAEDSLPEDELPREFAEPPGDLVMGPYVTEVSDCAAKIMWVGQPGLGVRCSLGSPDEGPAARREVETATRPVAGRPEVLYVAQVSGLEAARRYRYVISCGRERAEGAFDTTLPAGSRVPFRFVVYGDSQGRTRCHSAVLAGIRSELPFTFLLHLGDYSNDGTVWPWWKLSFFDPGAEVLREVALRTLRGNHEMDGVLYHSVFDIPPDRSAYSFDCGNVHFAVLDSERKGEELSRAVEWLDDDLSAARDDWVIVVYHRPSFNVGGHGGTWGRGEVLPVIEKYGVDLVLSGHSHLYERFRPIGPTGGKPTVYVVAGGGGGITYPASPSPVLEANYSGLHYCLFSAEGDKLEMTVKTPEGEIIDRLCLVKASGALPKEITAAAVPTPTAIDMVKAFKLQWGEFPELPRPGVEGVVKLQASGLPKGATIDIAASSETSWSVRPVTFRAEGEGVELAVSPSEEVKLAMTPWHGYLVPPLMLRLAITVDGDTRRCGSVPVLIQRNALAALVPPPEPVAIGRASRDEGQEVPPLHLPFTGAPSDSFRVAWRSDGLHGAVSVPEPQASSLELYFETDGRRRLLAGKESNASMLILRPSPDGSDGPADVELRFGRCDADAVTAAWKHAANGHILEFHLPTSALAPARMEAGAELGFHFVLRSRGAVVEQFADTSAMEAAWEAPVCWGALRLVDG